MREESDGEAIGDREEEDDDSEGEEVKEAGESEESGGEGCEDRRPQGVEEEILR
jgi:hypothetical protein